MTVTRFSMLTLVVMATVSSSMYAYACICDAGPNQDPLHELADNSLVFAGTVVRVNEAPKTVGCGGGSGVGERTAVFKVDEAFKGTSAGSLVNVALAEEGSSCGALVRVGDQFLLFSSVRSPVLTACTLQLPLGVGAHYSYCDQSTSLPSMTDQDSCETGAVLVELSDDEVLSILVGAN